MATRNYFVRYTSGWATLPFGEQFRGSYVLSVPAAIQYYNLADHSQDLFKRNTTRRITNFIGTGGINTTTTPWGGIGGESNVPRPSTILSANNGFGLFPILLYQTKGTPNQVGYIDSSGNLGMLGSTPTRFILSESPRFSYIEKFEKADYVYIEWGNVSREQFANNLIEWCSYNIHPNLVGDPQLDYWDNINIVINPDNYEHLIYPGNDPYADDTFTVADATGFINLADLTDW